MMHPVGPQPPSVYWRRRLLFIGASVLLVVLIVLTAVTVMSNGNSEPLAGASTGTPTNTPKSHHHSSPSPKHTKSSALSAQHSKSSQPPSSASKPAPAPCQSKDLDVAAVVAEPSYQVGEKPMLELQVTNSGSDPCVQDLADKQIELRVYNGESRVWGSHDCQIQPGTRLRTLPVGHAVRVSITWTGLSSQKGCNTTRQRVGAGTYTLYAILSGKMGTATTFALT